MLSVIATPIGNLDDLSPRALKALAAAEVIACEDTRRTRALLTHFGVARPAVFLSYRQGNEERVGEHVLRHLAEGRRVALCSDGGYPGISDPGYRLVRLAVQHGVPLEVLPGPSAVTVALVASGLPTSSYTFKGYPPRKPGPLRRFFADERHLPHSLVLFESPMRIGATLQAALEALGDRSAAVCVELTKRFERVARGYLADLAREFAGHGLRGEVTIVIAGNNPKFTRGDPPPELPATAEEGGDAEGDAGADTEGEPEADASPDAAGPGGDGTDRQ